jgi:hypothetical protein
MRYDMLEGAFVGVSLDSDLFTRSWVRFALDFILRRHVDVLFVLGDRLLVYNKALVRSANLGTSLSKSDADSRIEKRSSDIMKFLEGEISLLPQMDRIRVKVSRWQEQQGAEFTEIHRFLRIAYFAFDEFRSCVDSDVRQHLSRVIDSEFDPLLRAELCAQYVLEETAMIMSITEKQRPYEYYPESHIRTLTELYSGRFARFGLTVEELLGRPKARVFSPLSPEVK